MQMKNVTALGESHGQGKRKKAKRKRFTPDDLTQRRKGAKKIVTRCATFCSVNKAIMSLRGPTGPWQSPGRQSGRLLRRFAPRNDMIRLLSSCRRAAVHGDYGENRLISSLSPVQSHDERTPGRTFVHFRPCHGKIWQKSLFEIKIKLHIA